jgi:hypothetical protein
VTDPADPSLDVLLELDGQVLVVDPAGNYWVHFAVARVAVTPDKPHGLDYSRCTGLTKRGWSATTTLTRRSASDEPSRRTTA